MNASTYLNGRGQTAANQTAPATPDQQSVSEAQRQSQSLTFRRATKQDAKLRLAIAGPSGSGKTYTMLKLATELGGPIAVVDTERGSAEIYADLFEFDTLPLASYSPELVPQVIDTAAARGYKVVIIDSLSHFWTGINGELDQVEQIKLRSRNPNEFAAWRDITPKHERLIHAMISAPMHVLVSMRVKTEWIVEADERGKSRPRKIGLAPVMRPGIEYEFQICGDMDQDHNLIVTKSRCPQLADGVFNKPGTEVANILKSWLAAPKTTPDQKRVAEQRIAELQGNTPAATAPVEKPWKNVGQMRECFTALREPAGDTDFFRILEEATVSFPRFEFRTTAEALKWYAILCEAARRNQEGK